ncbi:hypothetical protein FSP39_003290 [Pinctada imbricata]|uniref:SH3 domain-containing protein n=1 Tax=Pinctada imbricata TaxID=66713 RepID=A0AA89BLG0_PINIB|nr:hypothetical protein FSP39_003290 [Pinctada imbricata]
MNGIGEKFVILRQGTGLFYGSGKLSFWRYANVELGPRIAIKIRFKPYGRSKRSMGLLSNCNGTPIGSTIDIRLYTWTNEITFKLSTNQKLDNKITLKYKPFEWNEAIFIYDGSSFSVASNEQAGQIFVEGSIPQRHPEIQVGGCGTIDGYLGYIDDVDHNCIIQTAQLSIIYILVFKMSSACESRDFNPSGTVPTIERNYPAVVLYTFIPGRKDSTEIFVSEGDIVQLLYSVGGWVYIRTYEGKLGYIPLEFVGDLECSKSLRSVTFDERKGEFYQRQKCNDDNSVNEHLQRQEDRSRERIFSLTEDDSVFVDEDLYSPDRERSVLDRNTNVRDTNEFINIDLKRHRSFESTQGYKQTNIDENYFEFRIQRHCTRDERSTRRNLDSCAICSAFLSKFIAGVQNLAITDREKADLKSRKLLKLLRKVAQDGLISIPSLKDLTNHNESHSEEIRKKCISNLHDLRRDQIPKFGENCDQCLLFKDFFKVAEKYSMTDLYATIRDLHIHALSESESDGEGEQQRKDGTESRKSVTNNATESWAKRHSTGEFHKFARQSEKLSPEIKRSASFQLESTKHNRSDIIRNHSFSGRTSSDNPDDLPTIRDLLPSDDIESDYSTPRNSASTAGRSSDTTGGIMSPTLNSRMPSIHSDEGYSSTDTGSTIHGFPERFSDPTPCLIPSSSLHCNSATAGGDELVTIDDDDNNNVRQKMQGRPGVYGFQSLITSSLPLSPRASPSKSPSYSNASKRVEGARCSNGALKPPGSFVAEAPSRVQTGSKPFPARSSFSKTLAERTKSFSDTNQSKTSQKSDHSPERTQQGSMHLQFQPPPIPGSECEASGHTTVPVIRGLQKTDNDAGRRIIARRFQTYRNPMEIKSTGGPMSTDRDIRKTLHDLSSVKRTTSMKNAPMRAQHSIPVQNPLKEGTNISGKSVPAKKFNKQIWRPSQGMPEGSDQRPFSPFGGTLPPSKITKKKVVEVFV